MKTMAANTKASSTIFNKNSNNMSLARSIQNLENKLKGTIGCAHIHINEKLCNNYIMINKTRASIKS